MIIANEYPKFQYVVQDQPHVISNAASVSIYVGWFHSLSDFTKVWNERVPGFLESGQVLLQGRYRVADSEPHQISI
jgi:hypothetical protein